MDFKKFLICLTIVFIFPDLGWSASPAKKRKRTPVRTQQDHKEIPLLNEAKGQFVKPVEEEAPSFNQRSTEHPSIKNEDNRTSESERAPRGGKNIRQWVVAMGSWREISILNHTDGRKIKINTLNVVGRFDRLIYFKENLFFVNLGLLMGHSENMNAESDFSYFQRSVLLSGGEFEIGLPIFSREGVAFGFSLGGIFRSISHAVPNSDYKFTTATRALPLFSLDFSWQISQLISFRQSLGTTGAIGDTFWSAGLGLAL
jgi:hypothetical protein